MAKKKSEHEEYLDNLGEFAPKRNMAERYTIDEEATREHHRKKNIEKRKEKLKTIFKYVTIL